MSNEAETAVELLNRFYTSSVTRRLHEKFLTPSFFDIIQKDRSETVHSNFLKWMFDLQGTLGTGGFNIISALLRAAHRRAKEQKVSFPDELAEAAYGHTAAISLTEEIRREYRCPGINYHKGRDASGQTGIVDLVISGTCTAPGGARPFKIIIENKVDSQEHDLQTWKYYTFFERSEDAFGQSKVVADGTAGTDYIQVESWEYNGPENELRIYLFLTPESNPADAKCSCEHYIRINYQDIMDHCINPMLQSSRLDARSRMYLEEYSRALSLPYINNIGKTIIMCLDPSDARLLKEFWEANQTLITMSLQALAQSSPEDNEEITNTLNAITNLQNKRKPFTIRHIPTGETRSTNQTQLMRDLMEMYRTYEPNIPSTTIKNDYNKIGSVFIQAGTKTTGYLDMMFADNTTARVTTQVQRNPEKLEQIKKQAEKDGFLIS